MILTSINLKKEVIKNELNRENKIEYSYMENTRIGNGKMHVLLKWPKMFTKFLNILTKYQYLNIK